MYKAKITLEKDQNINDVVAWTQKFAKQLFTWDNMPIPANHYEYLEEVIEGFNELTELQKVDLSVKVLDVINRSYFFTFKSRKDAVLFNAKWNENKFSVAVGE